VSNEPRLTLIEIVQPRKSLLTYDRYICLLMHALVGDDDRIVIDGDDIASIRRERIHETESLLTKARKAVGLGGRKSPDDVEAQNPHDYLKLPRRESIPIAQHCNPDRNLIYEEVNNSRSSNLTVAVEQVSMFLTGDRTLITFFQVQPLANLLIVAIWVCYRKTHLGTIGIFNHNSSHFRRRVVAPAGYN